MGSCTKQSQQVVLSKPKSCLERVNKTRIITTGDSNTWLGPLGQGWTTNSGEWNFLKTKEQWEGHEQALTIPMWKETKRTKKLEEAG